VGNNLSRGLTMERSIRFDLSMRVPSREIWSVLTDAQKIPLWWDGVHAVHLTKPSPGGVYRLDYEGGKPDECEILESRLGECLRYRWTSSEPEPTIVEYRLAEVDGGTTVTFINTGYKEGIAWDKYYDANFVGWLEMFLGIRRMLEVAHT
jgi:uncharacterized protein YndB with AHSA1/START domain